jgi:hypothetical protein
MNVNNVNIDGNGGYVLRKFENLKRIFLNQYLPLYKEPGSGKQIGDVLKSMIEQLWAAHCEGKTDKEMRPEWEPTGWLAFKLCCLPSANKRVKCLIITAQGTQGGSRGRTHQALPEGCESRMVRRSIVEAAASSAAGGGTPNTSTPKQGTGGNKRGRNTEGGGGEEFVNEVKRANDMQKFNAQLRVHLSETARLKDLMQILPKESALFAETSEKLVAQLTKPLPKLPEEPSVQSNGGGAAFMSPSTAPRPGELLASDNQNK